MTMSRAPDQEKREKALEIAFKRSCNKRLQAPAQPWAQLDRVYHRCKSWDNDQYNLFSHHLAGIHATYYRARATKAQSRARQRIRRRRVCLRILAVGDPFA